MDKDTAPRPARPRLNPYTKALRRERIFSRLRLGASSADIAREEGLSEQRVRKIVADALKRQEVDDLPDHALLQLVRLESAQALAASTVAGATSRRSGSTSRFSTASTATARLERERGLRRRRPGKIVRQDEPHRIAARRRSPQTGEERRNRTPPGAGARDAARYRRKYLKKQGVAFGFCCGRLGFGRAGLWNRCSGLGSGCAGLAEGAPLKGEPYVASFRPIAPRSAPGRTPTPPPAARSLRATASARADSIEVISRARRC